MGESYKNAEADSVGLGWDPPFRICSNNPGAAGSMNSKAGL